MLNFKRLSLLSLLTFMTFSISSCGRISLESISKSIENPPDIQYTNTIYKNSIKFDIGKGEKGFGPCADPFCLKADDGYYYLYSTNETVFRGDDYGFRFDYGPIWRSLDLVNWSYVGSVFDGHNDALKWGQQYSGVVPGVWAPNVVKIGDQYNYYYTLSAGSSYNPGIGVATAPTPYGPWTHYGKVFDSNEIGVYNSSDQDVFVDEDGKVWMIWGSGDGIYVAEMSPDGIDLYGGIDYAKEHMYKIAGWGWVQGSIDNFEAAHIVKKDCYYYLFLSLGGWDGGVNAGYHVVVAKSKSLLGGFKDSLGNDMMSPGDGDIVIDNNREFATGVGHCSVVLDDIGDYWIVYHGYDQTSSNTNARTLFIDKLLWNEKTLMPYVKNKIASSTEQLGPTIILKNIKKEELY